MSALAGLLGGFLRPNSSLFPLLMQFPLSIAQQVQTDRANAANDKRYTQLLRGGFGQLGIDPQSINSPYVLQDAAAGAGIDLNALRGMNADATKRYGAASADAANREAQLLSDYNTGQAPITKGYEDRYTRGMQILQGFGDQAKRDVNETFDKNRAAASASATARGLAGTSVLPSLQLGNERERSSELRRLNESLSAQKFNADTSLSGDVLNAKQTAQTNRQNILGQNVQNQINRLFGGVDLADQLNQRAFNYGNQALTNISNTIANRNDVAPSAGQFQALLSGLGSASGYRQALDQANANTFRNLFAGPVGAGLGSGIGAGVGLGTLGLLGGGFGAIGSGLGPGFGFGF